MCVWPPRGEDWGAAVGELPQDPGEGVDTPAALVFHVMEKDSMKQAIHIYNTTGNCDNLTGDYIDWVAFAGYFNFSILCSLHSILQYY